MKEITAYKTSDGSIYEDKALAEKHEFKSFNDSAVEAFLDSDHNRYQSGPQRMIAKTSILNWLRWKND